MRSESILDSPSNRLEPRVSRFHGDSAVLEAVHPRDPVFVIMRGCPLPLAWRPDGAERSSQASHRRPMGFPAGTDRRCWFFSSVLVVRSGVPLGRNRRYRHVQARTVINRPVG